MMLSVALRTGVFGVGDYSDIVHIYRRDGLAGHPLPYFDYPLEYPVVTGAFVWAVGFVHWGAGIYFVASAAVLGALAVATVGMLERLPSTRPWLLAAAPAVAFWGVQNWDFLAIALLVAALLLHDRERDTAGAALLAVAVWAKFFPVVALPVVVAVRLAQGRARQALLVVAVFAAVTLLVNAPVAIEGVDDGAVQLRDGWTSFFEFSHDRAAAATLWSALDVSVAEANRWSGVLLGAGLAALLGLAVRAARRGDDVLVPAAAAGLLWLFATAKVYSVQYSLWILLALALAGLPLRAMIAVAVVDVLLFVTLWGGLSWLGQPWPGTFLSAVRQGATALLAAWVVTRIAAPARGAGEEAAPGGRTSSSCC